MVVRASLADRQFGECKCLICRPFEGTLWTVQAEQNEKNREIGGTEETKPLDGARAVLLLQSVEHGVQFLRGVRGGRQLASIHFEWKKYTICSLYIYIYWEKQLQFRVPPFVEVLCSGFLGTR